ncbi:DUF1810 domain-containing protein [Sphingomonas sp. DG1-23]|uniref:DUF1810 domain-containing protein n=1 Tax=Sphingomonas sp. DG1-23 TaxID=3068316 RepID=UPI00273E0DD2|nr:DUF1810 domain-containing protein [Sphingomonas sp. DG1-23]MDP5279426.1 DUF1810 domain-containing protein [Sphingomonas sp. DG1-23]
MASRLERFVEAQQHIYPQALAELREGRKRSHWMWFVFPQIAGLGHSETALLYAIADLAEARAYLAHPLLGRRLAEATDAILAHAGRTPEAMLGGIDAVKLRSSMTLFEAAAGTDSRFGVVLDQFYGGDRDLATLQRLAPS